MSSSVTDKMIAMAKRIKSGLSTNFLIVIIGLALAASSCKVGEPYRQPVLNLPPAFTYPGGVADTVDNIGTVNWRTFFRDSVLVALIDLGLEHNLDLRQADAAVEIAREGVRRSTLARLPEISIGVQAEQERYSPNWDSGPNSLYYKDREAPARWFTTSSEFETALAVSWELDLWGKFRRQKEAAYARMLQSEAFRKAIQTSLVADIASSYYRLLMFHAKLKVAESNVRLNDSTSRIVKLQYRAGQVTSLAVSQTESQKLIAESLIPQIQRDIQLEQHHLSALLGRYPGDSIILGKELDDVSFLIHTSSGMPVELIRNRPDVEEAELTLIEANARVGAAQAMRYPSLRIGANAGLAALDPSMVATPNALFGAFVGSLTQPVFQGRKLKSNYRVALAERDIAELAFRKQVIEAVTEVSDKIVSIEKLREEYRIAEEQLVNSRVAVRQADLLFKTGHANYLEVINAQENALNVELGLAEVRMKLLISVVELYRALGGGWR